MPSKKRIAFAILAAVAVTVTGLVASYLNAARPPVGGAR